MRDTPERVLGALIAAFRKLKVPGGRGPGIPYEYLIPDIARQLLLMRPRPRAMSPKRLRGAHRKIEKLSAVEDLPLGARRALNSANLEMMIEISKAPAVGGRPREDFAAEVAGFVAEEYRRLTGRKPTVPVRERDARAYGPFLELVRDVFAALGIKASPVVWARHAVAPRGKNERDRRRLNRKPVSKIDA